VTLPLGISSPARDSCMIFFPPKPSFPSEDYDSFGPPYTVFPFIELTQSTSEISVHPSSTFLHKFPQIFLFSKMSPQIRTFLPFRSLPEEAQTSPFLPENTSLLHSISLSCSHASLRRFFFTLLAFLMLFRSGDHSFLSFLSCVFFDPCRSLS